MNTDPPVNNAPFMSFTHAGRTIEGWSRAAVQSYWRIPELNIGFDLGAHPWGFMGTPTWFISHTHLDHVAALPVYVARRRMMKMDPPTIYVPMEALDDVKKLMVIMHRLDRGRQLADVKGIAAGEVVPLPGNHRVKAVRTHCTGIATDGIPDEELDTPGYVLKAFDVVHTIPSRGFLVSQVNRKLKPEYEHLIGQHQKMKEARLAGEASGNPITEEVPTHLVAYTGDTAPAGLDANPEFFEAEILITEMSFIREQHRREKIHKFGHMHLDDFVERAHLFKNKMIVVGHFSTRYHPSEVRRVLEKKLPKDLYDRMRLCI